MLIFKVTVEPEHTVELPTDWTETLSAAGSVIVTVAVSVREQTASVTVTV